MSIETHQADLPRAEILQGPDGRLLLHIHCGMTILCPISSEDRFLSTVADPVEIDGELSNANPAAHGHGHEQALLASGDDRAIYVSPKGEEGYVVPINERELDMLRQTVVSPHPLRRRR